MEMKISNYWFGYIKITAVCIGFAIPDFIAFEGTYFIQLAAITNGACFMIYIIGNIVIDKYVKYLSPDMKIIAEWSDSSAVWKYSLFVKEYQKVWFLQVYKWEYISCEYRYNGISYSDVEKKLTKAYEDKPSPIKKLNRPNPFK